MYGRAQNRSRLFLRIALHEVIEMSKINVKIDYIKVGQYLNMIKYFVKKVEVELDKAVIEKFQERIDDERDSDSNSGQPSDSVAGGV